MKKNILFMLFILFMNHSFAQDLRGIEQDTLKLTIGEAETIFLNKNLDLNAQKYSIDSAKATVITYNFYFIRNFSFSNVFYYACSHHFFDPEISLQVSQLIMLAGIRIK